METIEKINEASDFDGPELDALIAQFEKTCKAFRIGSFPRKQKDLLNLVMARAEDTQDMSGHVGEAEQQTGYQTIEEVRKNPQFSPERIRKLTQEITEIKNKYKRANKNGQDQRN